MLVVSDIDDVFLPKPTDLLVNLSEARASLESLLGRLSDMFQENHTIGSALGSALQAGFKLMATVFSSPCGSIYSMLMPSMRYAGTDWRKDRRLVLEPSVVRRWCPEEQGRREDLRNR